MKGTGKYKNLRLLINRLKEFKLDCKIKDGVAIVDLKDIPERHTNYGHEKNILSEVICEFVKENEDEIKSRIDKRLKTVIEKSIKELKEQLEEAEKCIQQ